MRKLAIFSTIIGLFLFSVNALADIKVGVVNIQTVIQKAPQAAQMSSELKKQFSGREKQITEAQSTLQKDLEKYKKDSAVMSAADRQKSQDQLMKQQQELQQMQVSFQQDLMSAQNKKAGKLFDDIQKAISQVAAKDKLDLVLTSSNTLTNSPVAYVNSQYDITAQVLQALK